ncbi:hypothetical protein COR50_05740 [Chitinophaga caeni]|uniref:Thioredoxin domain-containing protein n=1 Tax=Chitinophaga caeni TaxID=2029983 RepID=A0A291QS60_9BACT|nr:TlpA family protein disulfide reductase [Chitinophaga caeni]ATL46722.1 hypothetical protein COR50_05740 [Chitinophaga caeni]
MQKLLFLLLGIFSAASMSAQGYEISVKVSPYTSGYYYLGHYMGKNTYLADSAKMDANGVAVIKGDKALIGGIYLIVMPGKQRYFEILLDKQQKFSIETDTSNFIQLAKFKNSPDNDLFYEYNRYLATEAAANEKLRKQFAAARTAADTAAVKEGEKAFGKRLQAHREDIIKKAPKSLLASIFLAMKEPEVPPMPKKADGSLDSTYPYLYYKSKYWDHFNFADERLVRTPIIENKLEKYFKQLVPMHPDSVIAACDDLIGRASKNPEMFKYFVWWCTYKYEQSPYMGFDAVFVHLVEKYYVSGKVNWISDEQLNKIINRAYSMAPNLIGQKAAPLELEDSLSKPVSLYNIKAKYTVLVFWDPTCGHCKTEIPRLDSAYKSSWKNKGVKILGIKTEGTKEQWEQFIAEYKLDWIHAWDPQYKSNYRRLYDVYSTPVVYLLDENKKILAKRLAVEQLDDFIDHVDKASRGN